MYFSSPFATENYSSEPEKLFQQDHHQIMQRNSNQPPFGMMQPSSSSSPSAVPGSFNISKDGGGGAYDLGELDHALFLYLDGSQDHHQSPQDIKQKAEMMRPHTLNIFPSQPMHVEPSPSTSQQYNGLVSPSEPSMERSNPRNHVANSSSQPTKAVKGEPSRRGPRSSSDQQGPKPTDPKTLRRLAQNREAARKSRLRKKAYVQQLESSRVRLTQLEQELHKARSQGLHVGGSALLSGDQGIAAVGNPNSDAALFDAEYTRWLEDHHRLLSVLQTAMQDHLPENELGLFVDNCLGQYDRLMSLKNIIVKYDVFHIFSGVWLTPAERCFMWIGGFRPSQLVKVTLSQIEGLTEQQVLGIYGLQQSAQEAEEALSQGLEALNQSLSETVIADSLTIQPNMGTYMSQMALAINKISTLEGFVRQADNLRNQTLHRLHQILTTRQAARCFLVMAEYSHRLRALSSLWSARPRQDV